MWFYVAKISKWGTFKYHSFFFSFNIMPCSNILLRIIGLAWYSPGWGRGNPFAKVPKPPEDSIGNRHIRMLRKCHFIIHHIYIYHKHGLSGKALSESSIMYCLVAFSNIKPKILQKVNSVKVTKLKFFKTKIS